MNKNIIIRSLQGILMIGLSALLLTGCSDVLETESSRDLFDYDLNSKSDSIFFTFGIMQSMQQLADQYVLQNEMRGELVDTTHYTDKNIRQLANFTATTANKYDSAYVYYNVINNCNYYIAHRDTTLLTGSTNVVMPEYAAVKAYRAWAYLMLARTYGSVPFFTQPLTQISEINRNDYPQYNMQQIVSALAPDLEQYSGMSVPDYGTITCGSTNFGLAKTAQSSRCFIPVDVILGEMYLETEQYAEAAQHYTKYLIANKIQSGNYIASMSLDWTDQLLPSDYYAVSGTSWATIFGSNSTNDIITYIPMSVNRLRGTITRLPQLFGYRYYSTSSSSDSLYTSEIQIAPSAVYTALADSSDYYYATDQLGTTVKSVKIGDMRRAATLNKRTSNGTESVQMRKYNYANVVLFRKTTVYLHLAEALNRLGYPDAAFAILKDGIDRNLLSASYVSTDTRNLLQTTYPFLSSENISIFDPTAGSSSAKAAFGIHKHGCGYTNGVFSPYQMDTIVGMKMKEIATQYQVSVGTSKADTINAMEDILCDEYAMEFAFEGTRFFDLCRLARHKNSTSTYSSDFGNKWLARKLASKKPAKDMTVESNWYLPFRK